MINHDRLFKELLTAHVWEFIELFLAEVGAYLDRDSLQLVDKELFADIPGIPRQEADLVFRGKFKGKDAFFLIHFEHQSTAPSDVPSRMLGYYFRLTESYGLPVYPVVIYSHERPNKGSNEYRVRFPDMEVLVFRFRQIVLNQLSWKDYLAHPNPVSAALMSLMGVKKEDRWRVKLECLRMLVSLKLDHKKMRFLSGFIDNYLRLSAQEMLIFTQETVKLNAVERGKVMEMTTSWKEEGLKEGIQIGRQEGRQEGQLLLVERLLRRRCGAMPKTVKAKLQELSSDRLEKLADALLDFKSAEDLETWLYQNA
jgi:hypothetical protein